MKCDAKMTNAHGSLYPCKTRALWWWNQDPGIGLLWHPRCGRHALMPGNTKRARVPITETPPMEGGTK